MKYHIPELNTLKSLQFAADINALDFSKIDNISFIADMKWVRPFGMLLTLSSLRQLRNSYPYVPFTMLYRTSNESVSYAGHMGFFKAISKFLSVGNSPGMAPGSENYLPITELDLYKLHAKNVAAGVHGNIGDTVERKSGELAQILSRNNKEVLTLMTYLLREILRNIPEHSESFNAWICGQYWSDCTAEIAILDEGIGIKESLQKNAIHRKYIVDDDTALRCSIKAGISQATNPSRGNKQNDEWANSGYGLYMVSEICKELQGEFCVASGNSFLYIKRNGEIKSGKTHFNGTAINISISTNNLSDSKNIISKIAKKGEIEASTIKNAFKKASHPSKGLILDL